MIKMASPKPDKGDTTQTKFFEFMIHFFEEEKNKAKTMEKTRMHWKKRETKKKNKNLVVDRFLESQKSQLFFQPRWNKPTFDENGNTPCNTKASQSLPFSPPHTRRKKERKEKARKKRKKIQRWVGKAY